MTDQPLSEVLQKAPIDMLHEIVRQAEMYLSAQLASAIAADQRAYTFSGLISGAVVLLIGASYSLSASYPPKAVLAAIAGGVAVLLFISAWMGAMSARSTEFGFTGSRPGKWTDDVENKLSSSLAEQCEHYDEMINRNRDLMDANSALFNRAVNLALASVGFGGLAYLFVVGKNLVA